jgi:uracil-DNA glycosylase family 4
VVPAFGSRHAKIAFVGEAPGRDEETYGEPFIGKSGQVFWQLVWRKLGLNKRDVWTTNLSKVRPQTNPDGSDNPPTDALITRWGPVLRDELEELPYLEVIVAVGHHAFKFLTGIDLPMEVVHGRTYRPVHLDVASDVVVVPCLHPAAGLRDPDQLSRTWLDLEMARQCLDQGSFGRTVRLTELDPPPTNYVRIESVDQMVDEDWTQGLAIDTEGTPQAPYCLTYSHREGEGRMIRSTDTHLTQAFAHLLALRKPTVFLHNALWDWDVLLAMGVDLLGMGLDWDDSMECQYLLETEPKGLKPSTARWFNVQLQEYEDVCRPYVQLETGWWLDKAVEGLGDLDEHIEHDWMTPKGNFRKKPKIIRCKCPLCMLKAKVLKWREKEVDYIDRVSKLAKDTIQHGTLVEAAGCPPPGYDLNYVPWTVAMEYACADADFTRRLALLQQPKLEILALKPAHDLDLAVWPFIHKMKRNGMPVDVDMVHSLKEEWADRVELLDESIRIVTGKDSSFNPGSPDQVAHLFFEEWGLPIPKMTKSRKRGSVDKGAIQELFVKYGDHDTYGATLHLFHDRVTTQKLLGYCDGILEHTEEDGRIHPRLNMTSVVSGRAAHFLLTFPTRTDEGRRIRGCFPAPKGWKYGSWDLSQIELRVMAHLSQDANMIQAFLNKEDLHSKTAAKTFGPGFTKEQRRASKTTNFLVQYLGSEKALFSQMKLEKLPYTIEDCREFIRVWLDDLYPGVKQYAKKVWGQVRRDGYVRSEVSGRIRYLPGIILQGDRWPDAFLRSEAQRQALNFKVQEMAKHILKLAMVDVMREVPDFHPTLDIHDELLGLVPDDEKVKADVMERMVDCMTRYKLDVPVLADGEYGNSWGDFK